MRSVCFIWYEAVIYTSGNPYKQLGRYDRRHVAAEAVRDWLRIHGNVETDGLVAAYTVDSRGIEVHEGDVEWIESKKTEETPLRRNRTGHKSPNSSTGLPPAGRSASTSKTHFTRV
jgi:hypothetical protein